MPARRSPDSRTLTSLGALLCVLAVAPLAGCGSGEGRPTDDGSGPAVQRLALTPVTPRAPRATRTVQHFEVGEELPAGWTVEGGEFSLVRETRSSRGEPWQGLRVVAPKEGRVIVPGPFDPRTFNRAAITLVQRSKVDLYVLLYLDGRVVSRTPRVRIEGTGDPQTVVIDLPDTLRRDGPVDAVGFVHRPLGKPPTFLSFALLWTPLEDLLPDPALGPAPVVVGDEIRAALGLSSASALEARFSAPRGARLVLGFGRPPGVARKADKLTLHVRVEGPAGVLANHRLRLRRDAPELARWSNAELPLPDVGGAPLRATFTLEGAGPRGAVCALAVPRVERRVPQAPTVVLVTSDTHRADHLGTATGGVEVRTPFLDGLAERGVLFEDCFAPTNITNPSHASLLTALPTRDTGMVDNVTALDDEAVTLAERFRDAGFLTLAAVSAGHLGHGQSGLGQGFDRMYAPPGHRPVDSTVTLERLGPWIAQAEGRPLFLWLHVFDAHGPYDPPRSHRWLYYDRGRDPRDPALPPLPKAARPQWDREVRDLEFVRSQYRSEVTYLDEQLGDFLGRGRFAQGIVAVTADHGEFLGNLGLYYTHSGLYPDTLAVPLILAWPGAPAGTRVGSPVSNTDLGRTLLDLAGLGRTDFPGHSLLRFLQSDAPPAEPRFAISSHAHSASVELGGWYLVLTLSRHLRPPRATHQVELYHLPSDPDCARDVVDQEHHRARALRALLVDWLAAGPTQRLSHASAEQDPETLAQLAALGYAADADRREHDGAWYEADPDDPWVRRFEE